MLSTGSSLLGFTIGACLQLQIRRLRVQKGIAIPAPKTRCQLELAETLPLDHIPVPELSTLPFLYSPQPTMPVQKLERR